MKKFFVCALTGLMFICLISGCGCQNTDETTETATDAEEVKEEGLPIEDTLIMYYSPSAGEWSSTIYLGADGSFTGSYNDTDAGDSGEGYDSTIYQCEFAGKFGNIKQVEDYAYSMTLESLETAEEEGVEKFWELGQGVMLRVVSTEAVGVAEGEEFMFYLPTAPVSELCEEFLWWNPAKGEVGETLDRYGLYNIATDAGFFTYD